MLLDEEFFPFWRMGKAYKWQRSTVTGFVLVHMVVILAL